MEKLTGFATASKDVRAAALGQCGIPVVKWILQPHNATTSGCSVLVYQLLFYPLAQTQVESHPLTCCQRFHNSKILYGRPLLTIEHRCTSRTIAAFNTEGFWCTNNTDFPSKRKKNQVQRFEAT